MSIERIAARYARSLLELSVEQKRLDEVLGDIQHFMQVCSIRDFDLLLRSPIINTGTKRVVFQRLFTDYDPITMGFLDIALRKGREEFLPEIGEEFVSQYRELKEISHVKLTTAIDLSDDTLEEIKSKIADSGITYRNVELETHVDGDLLGGFVLEFDDKLYDVSVAHKLEEMRRALTD